MGTITISNQLDKNNWKYLPESNTLCQYLNRNDIIEVSKLCKNYRKQLLVKILTKLNLVEFSSNLSIKELHNSFDRAMSLDGLLSQLKSDLDCKLLTARKVVLDDYFNCQFSKKLIYLIPNITRLVYYPAHYSGTLLSLSTILNGLKHLRYVEFNIILNDTLNFNTTARIFPLSLTSIKINPEANVLSFLPIFDTIDFNYTNLVALSITSNIMLTNFYTTMPNLKEVDIVNSWNLDNSKFIEFFKKNPQITKLATRFDLTNSEVYNTVLSSKHLRFWSIERNEYFFTSSSFPSNCSITHLKLNSSVGGNIALQLFNACLNLKVVEFVKWKFVYNNDIEWSKLERGINTLRFIKCHFCSTSYMQALEDLHFFYQANFIFAGYTNHIDIGLKNINFKNYILITSSTKDSQVLYMKKKLIN
jgi:hypothetical protein